MNIFQSEQARVDDRIDEVIPLLEDVAARGGMIAGDLHNIKNVIKYPDSLGIKLIGSGLHPDNVSDKFGQVKNELDVYAEKSSIVIKELTKILTEIRDKTVTLWVLGTPCSSKSLLVYLVVITAVIALTWIYSVSAVICDNQVTGAFMANAIQTRQLPFFCFVDRRLLDQNKTELVLYIARQSTIAYSAKRFSEWAIAIFISSIIYSIYRNRRERKFRRTAEGQSLIAENAKTILIRWLLEHGYQSPSYLNSRYLEVEYLIESSRFVGNDSRCESEYDEISDEEEYREKNDETTEPETPPEPVHVDDKSLT